MMMLEPGTLWTKVQERTKQALHSGALQSLPTAYEIVADGGIRFIVRMLANLAHRDAAQSQQKKQNVPSGTAFDPFLPYEPSLFVADLSPTHICLLNKFNVVAHHLLIVTRTFEEQESLLTLPDFVALWTCMVEFEGLAFYNGGKIAGASQHHKHLQYVALPLAPDGLPVPIEAVLGSVQFQDGIGTAPSLPFVHAIAQLDPSQAISIPHAAAATFATYHKLLQKVGLPADVVQENQQIGPYNLLTTRHWMLLVPRTQEQFGSISINSLGFAGSLLVRNQQEMDIVKKQGPLNILKSVALSVEQ